MAHFKKTFLASLLGMLPLFTYSTHITGGEFTLKHLAGNTFLAQMKLISDCASAGPGFDPTVTISVFDKVTNEHIEALDFTFTAFEVIPFNMANACIQDGCPIVGIYEMEINLPDNPNGYYLVKERCCRNNLSLNLSGEDLGFVFKVEIPDPALENSSPQFNVLANEYYFCTGNQIHLDFGATDADQDSLVYSISTPLIGASDLINVNPVIASSKPYAVANWAVGYDTDNPVGGSPNLTIDSETGEVVATPTQIGFFTIAVLVEEYRDGIKIGEIRREVQIASGNCPENQAANFESTPAGNEFQILANEEFCLNFETTNPSSGQEILFSGSGDFFETPVDYDFSFESGEDILNASAIFCWTPDESQVMTGFYELEIHSSSIGCLQDTIRISNTYSFEVIGVLSTEMERSEGEIEFYPNPATARFKIDNCCAEGVRRTIRIMDLSGKLVYSGTLTEGEWVDIHQLEESIYFIQLLDNNQNLIFSDKLVVAF